MVVTCSSFTCYHSVVYALIASMKMTVFEESYIGKIFALLLLIFPFIHTAGGLCGTMLFARVATVSVFSNGVRLVETVSVVSTGARPKAPDPRSSCHLRHLPLPNIAIPSVYAFANFNMSG